MNQSKIRTRPGDDLAYKTGLNEQIVRMRELLRLMSGDSDAAALGAIREAFPEVPLSDRVRALREFR